MRFCLFVIAAEMARNGVVFSSQFPAKSTASYHTNANTSHRRFTFTYDDLYNCLYRHNEPQLIDIEVFKGQRKACQNDGKDTQKEVLSKSLNAGSNYNIFTLDP